MVTSHVGAFQLYWGTAQSKEGLYGSQPPLASRCLTHLLRRRDGQMDSDFMWFCYSYFFVLLYAIFMLFLCQFSALDFITFIWHRHRNGIRCTFSNRGNGCRPGSDRWFGERQGHHGEAKRLGCTGQIFCWEKGGMIWRNNSCILISMYINVY